MNASSAENAYTHWEICFPDESGVRTNGEIFKLLPKYSFRDRVKKGFTVSERRTSPVAHQRYPVTRIEHHRRFQSC